MREHEPQNRNHSQNKRKFTLLFIGERRLFMRNERADTDHVRVEFLQKTEVCDKICRSLERGAHHKAGTYLITDLLEVEKTSFAVFRRQFSRMKFMIMSVVGRFVTQKIAVCPGVKQFLITFTRFFAE